MTPQFLSIPRSIKNCPIEEAGKIQPRKKSVRFSDGQRPISWWNQTPTQFCRKSGLFRKNVLLLGLRWVLGTLFSQHFSNKVRIRYGLRFFGLPPPPPKKKKKKKKKNKTQHYVGKTLGSEYAFLCSAQVTYSLVHKTLHRAREGSPGLRKSSRFDRIPLSQ